MDVLNFGDIVIFVILFVFCWVYYKYVIECGFYVFMEKFVIVDGLSVKKMFELVVLVDEKNFKCGVGLMVWYCCGC